MSKGELSAVRAFICFFILLCTINFSTMLYAKESLKNLRNLSLEELMNIEVSVNTKTNDKPLKESPSIISVITSEDIENSGARDLIDILRLVPGFNFGVDVFNTVGVGTRGNWAYDGKILLLIDGIQMNERNYGGFALGNHYPVEHIERIEVIRGPGAVNYGGFAELGVINIITKNAETIDGTHIQVTHGQMTRNVGRQNLSFMHGSKLQKDSEITIAGYVGKGQRSDELYKDYTGNTISMNNNSDLNPHFLNIGLKYGDFSSRVVIDNYRTTNRDSYGLISDPLWRTDFRTWSYQATYNKLLTDDLKLTLDAGYANDVSWVTDNGFSEDFTKTTIEHFWIKNNLRYKVSEKFNLAIGLEVNSDKSVDNSLINPQNIPHFHYYSLFAEGDHKSSLGNLTLGLRYDQHNLFGGSFAPRIALTKVIDKKLHYKLLYSHSFRTPMTSNVVLNSSIEPERTTVLEAELGYQIHQNMNIVLNIFDNKTQNTIVYDVLPETNREGYFNADKTGTRGIEAEWRFKEDWGNITISHSYYRTGVGTASNQKVIDFQNGIEQKLLHLGLPAHKTVLNLNYKFTPQWNFNSSLIHNSTRYGYDGEDENGVRYLKRYSSAALVNIFFRYESPSIKGLDLGFGIYDLFNSRPPFIQPYNAGHSPLPSPSREVVFKLGYKFN